MNTIKSVRKEEGTNIRNFYADSYEYWSTTLAERFSAKVTIKLNQSGSGKIIIHVDSPEAIERLIKL